MFQVIKVQTRPNTEIPFFHDIGRSEEYKAYFTTHFKDTGKNISTVRELSEDLLTATSTSVWASQEAFYEFTTDSYCYENFILPGQIYDLENQIASDTTTATI